MTGQWLIAIFQCVSGRLPLAGIGLLMLGYSLALPCYDRPRANATAEPRWRVVHGGLYIFSNAGNLLMLRLVFNDYFISCHTHRAASQAAGVQPDVQRRENTTQERVSEIASMPGCPATSPCRAVRGGRVGRDLLHLHDATGRRVVLLKTSPCWSMIEEA